MKRKIKLKLMLQLVQNDRVYSIEVFNDVPTNTPVNAVGEMAETAIEKVQGNLQKMDIVIDDEYSFDLVEIQLYCLDNNGGHNITLEDIVNHKYQVTAG